MTRLHAAGLVLLLLTACGDAEENQLNHEVTQLEARRDALKSDLAVRELVRRSQPGSLGLASLHPVDLARAYTSVMPIEFDAGLLASEVGGRIRVESVEDARLDGDDLRFTLKGRGQDIKVNVFVPPPYDKMAVELIAGLQDGLDLKLRGRVFWDGSGLQFQGQCESAQLHSHGQDDFHRLICNQVNDRLLDHAYTIHLSANRSDVPDWKAVGFLNTRGMLSVVTSGPVHGNPTQPAVPPAPDRHAPPPPNNTPAARGPVALAAAPTRDDLVAHCAQTLQQLFQCKAQSADMLLSVRAGRSTQVHTLLQDPRNVPKLKQGIQASLERDGGAGDAHARLVCNVEVPRTVPSLPEGYLTEFRRTNQCWNTPCAARVKCLEPFVKFAVRMPVGRWLR